MKVSFRVAHEKKKKKKNIYIYIYIVFVSTWSLLGVKKAWATTRSVSFRGLIQNFRRASPLLSYAESRRNLSYLQQNSRQMRISNGNELTNYTKTLKLLIGRLISKKTRMTYLERV